MKNTKNELNIPREMLEAANIPADAVLTITLEDGAITITESDLLDFVSDELFSLFDELGISPDAVRAVLAEDNGISTKQRLQ